MKKISFKSLFTRLKKSVKQQPRVKDPFAKREAEKYDQPIPSREFILELLAKEGKALTREELEASLLLSDPEQQEALRRRLRAMERDGQLIRNRRRAYGPVDQMNLIRGRVLGHKDGFGFIVPDDRSEDLFLSPRQMRAVFDGDKVLVHILGIDSRGRREAAIVEVLERNTPQIVGRFFIESGVGFIEPTNRRIAQTILIPHGSEQQAQSGQIVVADIISQPTERQQPIGKITSVLGDQMAAGMEVDIALRAHALPFEWSAETLAATRDFKKTLSPVDYENRQDLRALPLVTIDGEDAKDFDDAVYCQKLPKGGWRLFVAIADVSYYVKPDAPLDRDAKLRGTSVYFPGQVIPMLPEVLSNELCSLKPKVDRLCMVCDMSISSKGDIERYDFYEAVIHSHARLTYNQVSAMLVEKDETLMQQYAELLPHLEHLYALYEALHASREKRGAIDFETVETRIVFGANKKISKIVPVVRNDAHRLIEECMLAANVCAAKYLLERKIPALYRIHPGPNPEKLNQVHTFFKELGLKLGGGDKPEPSDYADLLNKIKPRPDAHILQMILLRSMNQAVYQPENVGHFGLAYDAYAHFTSPIRRYPDLLVHRAIRHAIHKGHAKNFTYDEKAMQALGEHCSMTERRADSATYDAMDWLKCEFMQDKLGQEFDGLITSVTAFGIFVQLKDIFVEGLVHITELKDDYYKFDPIRFRLTGERSGTVYHLGDPLRVLVAKADLDERKIDFALIKSKDNAKPKGKPRAKNSRKK